MTIQLVTSDDGEWAGVYTNGRLHYQSHSIPDDIWLGLLKGTSEEIPDEAMEEMGELPVSFADIVWKATPVNGKPNIEDARRT